MERHGAIDVERMLAARTPDGEARGVLAAGETVGEWQVCAFLGRGLSAEVYRVVNRRFGQEGALKLLVDGSRGLKERFTAEADALRFLSLKTLPRFMGSGDCGGRPYYVMEYLRPLPDPMPPREIPRFMNGVAKAVQNLHDAGYIHRDLKPGNVLRRANGEPVLIDLGLVKRRGERVCDPIVRRGGKISMIDGKPVGVGTLDYAAPEQLLRAEASVQSDIFALGKMLLEFYGGRPPRNIRPIIRCATREQPGDRYASADEFASALRHRNYPRIAFALSVAVFATGTALFPLLRPHIAKVLVPLLNPAKQEIAIKQHPDESAAAYLSRMLERAKKGEAQAQIAVAEAYFYGRGTPTNRIVAVEWYRTAAEAGESEAQASLGFCLFRGIGCEKNTEQAAQWWKRAAESGNLCAMNDYAFCLMHGFGVEKDESAAFKLALDAAVRGHPPSQTMVGECYLDARGVEKDVDRGETWLYRAARQGNKRAQMLLETR